MEHLLPEVRSALDLPLEERIEFCKKDHWVGYTKAENIVQRLDDLLTFPKSVRMPNALLVGRPNNGKSSVLQRFVSRHPFVMGSDGLPASMILWISLPGTPTRTSFWSSVLLALNISHRSSLPAGAKLTQALNAMETANVRLLAIDEFNHLTNSGKEAPLLLADFKHMSNVLKVPIVAAGTQVAVNALRTDPQLMTRFEALVLDRWQLNKEYLRFLASFEQMLPLPEASNLASRELAPVIYDLAGDVIGNTVAVLRDAAVIALSNGLSRIDAGVINQVRSRRASEWDDIAKRA